MSYMYLGKNVVNNCIFDYIKEDDASLPIIENLKKTVNFYDYDGTLLHSYTREEALGLSELPSLPDRTSEGLTCQGWNWTLSDIQLYLTENEDDSFVDVGATYIPTDRATHINITFADKYRSEMPLMFKGNVTIDWGDGNTQRVNHTSAKTVTHEYAIAQSYPAKYTIKLKVNSGTLTFGNGSSDYNICGSTTNDESNPARAYASRINSVFIGSGVTSIGKEAFSGCYSLASISIPNGVTSIGEYAFIYCRSLTSISIPNGVTGIYRAFRECYSLASVTIPNSVTSIGPEAFSDCYSLASISIPNGVTSIDSSAFSDCYSLASISIPNGVTSIGNYAFASCRSLASVNIPSSVTSIGNNAFRNCSSITSITIPSGVKNIGNQVFYQCYSLASVTIPNSVTSIGEEAFRNCSSITSITIPSGVTSIGYGAFNGCSYLASVTIPNSVTSIGNYAFASCRSLASVNIPNGVKNIGNHAFYQCYSLASVTIPSSVTSIDTYAFYQCYSLASVTIPSSVTSIDSYAFYQCYGIIKYDFSNHTAVPTLGGTYAFYNIADDAKIVVPDALYDTWITSINWSSTSVKPYIIKVSDYDEPQYVPPHTIITYTDGETTEIEVGDDGILTWELAKGGSATYEPNTTIQSVAIGSDVTTIGDYAFNRCESLTSITIPESVTSIGEGALANTDVTSITIPSSVTSIRTGAFLGNSYLTSITIPESVTSIGHSAFRDCTSLISVSIPEGVTSIGNDMFFGCKSLTSVTIPSSVTSIRTGAFRNCTDLTSVDIPESVTSIGNNAFSSCSNLTLMDFSNHTSVPTLGGTNAFYNIADDAEIVVPDALYDEWIEADNWSDETIKPHIIKVSEYVPPHTIITYIDGSIKEVEVGDDGVLTWEMTKGRSSSNAIIDMNRVNTSIQSVVIGSDVTSIGGYAFYSCSGLTSITIPEGVTSIGYNTFAYCTSLTSVTIPSIVTSIGDYAFSGCSMLNIVVDEDNPNYTSKDGTLFNKAMTILICAAGVQAAYTIPSTVTSIGSYAFEDCTSLTSVTIPEGVTSIGTGAFEDCTGLTSVTIPSSVTVIASSAFYGCSSLTLMDFSTHTSVPTLSSTSAFSGIATDAKIVVPDALYDTWIVAKNWSSTSVKPYIIKVSEYVPPHTIITYIDGSTKEIEVGDDGILTWEMTKGGSSYSTENTTIKSVEIGGDVKSIGTYAFYACDVMTSVTIPSTVTSIGNNAFNSCAGLTSITIPSSVTSIEQATFYNCSGLTSVTISEGVTSIGRAAFYDCTSLTSITIPSTVTSIGVYAFRICSGLTSVTIPSSVTSIGNGTFEYCSSLNDIIFDKTAEEVSSMTNYSWGISSGKVIKCTDGNLTVS